MGTMIAANESHFKTCPMCKSTWRSMDSFLDDPHLSFNGYQSNFDVLEEGIYFFTHNTQECGSTMGLRVGDFFSLYSGPKYPESKQLSRDCPRYCLDKNNLNRCSAECANAFAREICQVIKERLANHAAIALHSSKLKPEATTLSSR